jgi:hypothetical protein
MKIMLAYSLKTNFFSCLMVAKSWNKQLFSVLAVVCANDGWKKLQFAYFDYFPVYYFVQVHSICLIEITVFVTKLTRWVPLVEQELLTLPEHLSSHPVFSGTNYDLQNTSQKITPKNKNNYKKTRVSRKGQQFLFYDTWSLECGRSWVRAPIR